MRIASDLAFSRDNSAWFLPWMLAVVVYMGALALAAIIVAQVALDHWQSDNYSAVTIQLPAGTEMGAVADVLEVLNGTLGVERARLVTREEMISLLEPWVAAGEMIDQLPIPWLIEVLPRKDSSIDWVATQNQLSLHVSGVLVDTGIAWVGKLSGPARTFQATAVLFLALIIFATISAVSLAARAALAIHSDTIEVMHLLGAEDDYIIRQFQRRFVGLATRGGIAGTALAVITMFTINYVPTRLEVQLLPSYEISPGCWLAVVAMPMLIIIVSAVSVRRVVGRKLSSML